MSDLILPASYARRDNPLAEFLRGRDRQDFQMTVQLTDLLSRQVAVFGKRRRLRNQHVLKALLGTMVSCVQAMAPHDEWSEVAEVLAQELRGRLTVEQD